MIRKIIYVVALAALAARFGDDRPGYTEAKDDFIEKTLAQARREMEGKKP